MPGAAPGTTVLVHAGSPEASALYVRMRSRSPSSQMPPLGTVVRDQEAVDAISRWIREELAAATRSIPGPATTER
jgi:erythromycin esterase-like protein